ncbi:MAG: hydantoinase/oxoprolinase family protein [Candidatus Thiodiazotropha sp. L084R]
MRHNAIIGWDLGGAHTKAALVNGQGGVDDVMQIACPLWQGLENLQSSIDEVLKQVGESAGLRHAVTMTGELVDLFPDRESGVNALIDTMSQRFTTSNMVIFGGASGFLDLQSAKQSANQVASANWLATASWAASRLPEGLLIDMGSTTTDLIPFANKRVMVSGFSDHQRLVDQTMIYTGVVRTPLMAIADKVPFAGEWVSLMAEHFATTADIYRLTGELPGDADLLPSADGGEKSCKGSTRRLARMLGLDMAASDTAGWRMVSEFIAEKQLRLVQDAGERLLSAPGLSTKAPLIGAGAGRFMIEKLSRRLNRPYLGIESLFTCEKEIQTKVADCAPAVAVASLAMEGSI